MALALSEAIAWTELRARLVRTRKSCSGSASTSKAGSTVVDEFDAVGGVDAEKFLDVVDKLPQPKPAARRRRLLGAAIGEHALGIGDGAIERTQQLRRESLHRRIPDAAQPVGQELHRSQDVAHVVIDLGHGEAKVGEMFLLAERLLQLLLHAGTVRARRRRFRRSGLPAAMMRPGSSGACEKASIERVMARIGRIMILSMAV